MEIHMKRPCGFALALLLAGCAVLTGCTGPKPPPNPSPTPDNVAILVVDDFGLGKDHSAADSLPVFKDENCTVGATDVGSNGAGQGSPPSGHSHGELVYQALKEKMTQLIPGGHVTTTATTPRPPSSPAALGPIETSTEWTYHHATTNKDYRVRLVAVHASKFSTKDVLAGISGAIQEQQASVSRFVVNLSFVVIPCDVIRWLKDSDHINGLLATYSKMLENDPELRERLEYYNYLTTAGAWDMSKLTAGDFTMTVLRDDILAPLRQGLVDAFYRAIDLRDFSQDKKLDMVYSDPHWQVFLNQWVRSPGSSAKVILVGAAGNGVEYGDPPVRMGLPFPFAPALWDFVVSASGDGPSSFTDKLNSGEVKLAYAGPTLAPESLGTSFAAPRLSALEALYLMETGRVVCDGNSPPLGYINAAIVASAIPSKQPPSPWQNLGTADWPAKCNDFPQK